MYATFPCAAFRGTRQRVIFAVYSLSWHTATIFFEPRFKSKILPRALSPLPSLSLSHNLISSPFSHNLISSLSPSPGASLSQVVATSSPRCPTAARRRRGGARRGGRAHAARGAAGPGAAGKRRGREERQAQARRESGAVVARGAAVPDAAGRGAAGPGAAGERWPRGQARQEIGAARERSRGGGPSSERLGEWRGDDISLSLSLLVGLLMLFVSFFDWGVVGTATAYDIDGNYFFLLVNPCLPCARRKAHNKLETSQCRRDTRQSSLPSGLVAVRASP